MFFNGARKPALTKAGEELSGLVLSLDAAGQKSATDTICAIVHGVRTMGNLPEPIISCLWTIVITIARKALMPGADSAKIFAELQAGIHPFLKDLIEREARR